jgi:HEAT repeat protein
VPALISAAQDPSERVRVAAIYALADARDPWAAWALAEANPL